MQTYSIHEKPDEPIGRRHLVLTGAAACDTSMTASESVDPHRTRLLPPLKWPGGKRWQLAHLKPIWQPYGDRRLVEPFCGGLAVALGLRPDRALLNDANAHVISFYLWLQRGLRIDFPMENDGR